MKIELDRTDAEREELVKQWIKDYWLYVVVVVGIAIGLVYGLNYYRQSKIAALHHTAAETEQVGSALATNKLDVAETAVAKLQSEQPKTSFATVATLELAKKYFDDGDYAKAIEQYEWLIGQSGDVAIRDMARLRKARSQSDAGEFNAAVDTLDGLESQAYFVESALLKGDILMENEQFDAAKKVYESIKDEGENLNPQVIQGRLDLLTIKQQKAS